jgi:hypothetical protein
MERLIKDAAKLDKSVKANDLSFGNIVKAINVVQTEMGITGTTALEAASTISGSVSSMKAAWQFIVNKGWLGFWDAVYIFDEWVGIDELFDQNGWDKTNESLIEWAMNRGEDAWDGLFYFSECEVYEED